MKSILYAGAALMLGASIYGFVDFKKKNASREFKELYNEGISLPVMKKSNDFVIVPVPEDKKVQPGVKKEIKKIPVNTRAKKKKKLNPELFSRAPLRNDNIGKKLKPVESKTKETEL